MRQQEEGWRDIGEKYVCPRCVSDYAIQAFIRRNPNSQTCDYCKRRSKRPIAADVNEVFSFIAQGLHREYEDPVQNVGYISAEGGYVIQPDDSDDVLAHHDLDQSHEGFWEDLIDSFRDAQWVHQDPYGMRRDEELIYTWKAFSRQVRHRTRFVFFRAKTSFSDAVGGSLEREPHAALDSLGYAVEDLCLLRDLPVGSPIVRARQHAPKDRPKGVGEIGPLAPERATQQNRFSPPGIPMFYGSRDATTAIVETYQKRKTAETRITVGRFRTTKVLRMLDLTELPKVPSLFDETNAHLRAPTAFLRHFIEDARRPINLPGTESYEYVPTQVVAEYFRHIFEPDGGTKLNGISYRSAKKPSGINYTLFLDADDCGEVATPETSLVLERLRTHKVSSLRL